MPIYEYRCGACGHHLEALQKMSEGPLRKCPDCGKSKLRRLVSAPQFRLKGSGWYETDFKGDKEKKRNLVESGAAESSDSAASDSAASGDTAAKAEADKSVAAAKSDGAGTVKPKAKPAAPVAKKKPAKSRATKAARA